MGFMIRNARAKAYAVEYYRECPIVTECLRRTEYGICVLRV